jgi:hypothetical protein
MLEALEGADVPAELVEIPGKFHAVAYEFKKPPSLGGETVFEASVAWLDQYIDQAQAESPSPSPSPATREESGALSAPLLVAIIVAVLLVAGLALAVPRMRRRS